MKSRFFLLTLFLMIGAITGNAQTGLVVNYENHALQSTFEGTLYYDGTWMHYQYHQPEQEKTLTDHGNINITFKKDFYDWYYHPEKNKRLEIRELESDDKTHCTWQNHSLEWEITDETTEILGYTVQKAITKAYKNSGHVLDPGDAIAWFAPDIPISGGPERYFGLPGLILKLEFSRINFYTIATEIKKVEIPAISPQKEGVEISNEKTVFQDRIDPKWLKAEKKKLEQAKGK